jgi:hypothetical protein
MRDGSNHECHCEIADKGALPCTYPTSDGREMRLLVVQEVSHDNPRLLHVFDCGWYGPKHDHGPEETHLYGVLVHGIRLYADVWIDAHHKHDSNQVITSVVHVIVDVRWRKGRLPPTLQIQADNCTQENKNIYMFALCAALVGLGYFQEVQLCFLIVGHMHEDIDQCFSIILNTLKRTNIDSLKELLELVQRGTWYTEAFMSARHLENVWDWKSFITPHLLIRGDTITGITFPHHMRFYMENGVTQVQYKHFSKDAWGPTKGHVCLRSLPKTAEKSALAEVHHTEERELKALDEFIVYKTRCV